MQVQIHLNSDSEMVGKDRRTNRQLGRETDMEYQTSRQMDMYSTTGMMVNRQTDRQTEM